MRPLYSPSFVIILTGLALGSLLHAPAGFGQQAPANAAPLTGSDSGERNSAVDPGAANSTVVYESGFFDQYNPITASDMLDRIPGVNVFGGNRGGGGRGLGTGGNILINGQRIAGKDNSARDQLDRITAAEVERIEIIRTPPAS